jgi:hypothetical protein
VNPKNIKKRETQKYQKYRITCQKKWKEVEKFFIQNGIEIIKEEEIYDKRILLKEQEEELDG